MCKNQKHISPVVQSGECIHPKVRKQGWSPTPADILVGILIPSMTEF